MKNQNSKNKTVLIHVHEVVSESCSRSVHWLWLVSFCIVFKTLLTIYSSNSLVQTTSTPKFYVSSNILPVQTKSDYVIESVFERYFTSPPSTRTLQNGYKTLNLDGSSIHSAFLSNYMNFPHKKINYSNVRDRYHQTYACFSSRILM